MVPLYYAREVAQYGRGMAEPDPNAVELYERAYAVLTEQVPRHPANIYNYYLLALIKIEWGKIDPTQLDQALIDIDKALEYSPERQQLRYVRGKILLLMGRYDEAIAYYQSTVDLNPDVTESWWNLGIANYQTGHYDEAIVAFERSMEIGRHPANLAETAAMIDIYAKQGNMEKVIKMYNLAIDRFGSQNPRLYAGIAAAYFETGEYELARMHANIAKQLDPSLSADTNNFLEMIDFVEAGGSLEELIVTSTDE
jgi:pentatricopeptide repeat protein